MFSESQGILSFNCIRNESSEVQCELFTNYTYIQSSSYKIQDNPLSDFYFLQLPTEIPVTTSIIRTSSTSKPTFTSSRNQHSLISIYGSLTVSTAINLNRMKDQVDSLLGRKNGDGINLGRSGPQYIQIKFPKPFNVSRVCLLVNQNPGGVTKHYLYSGFYENKLTFVKNITGFTYNNQWINLTFESTLTDVKYLKLRTVKSDSWVAWRRFLVYQDGND